MTGTGRKSDGRQGFARVLLLAAGGVLIAIAILGDIGARTTLPLRQGHPGYRGLELWRSHNCGSCHAVFGLGGHIGPDLTNVMRRRNDAYVRYVLHHGVGAMPSYDLDESASSGLIAYLRNLDALGTYPLDSSAAPWFGIP